MSEDKPARIIAIVDKSYSMDDMRDVAISGFNSFMDEQKGVPGKAVLTLIFFNHAYELVHTDRNLTKLRALTREAYVPAGNTAMWDAIGRTVSDALINEDEFSQTVVFIMTDGEENASREYDAKTVRELVESAQNEHGWQFFFAAANIDAPAAAEEIGIVEEGTVMAYAADEEGTRKAFAMASSYVTESRTDDGGDDSDLSSAA